jgi:hypothetical protein
MATSTPLPDTNWNQWTYSPLGIRASPSHKPDNAKEPATNDIFGQRLVGSLAYFDRDSSCWRTYQGTFNWASDQYLETWPDSGMTRNGCAYELQTSGPATSERESLWWPTPDAALMNDGADPQKHKERQQRLKEKHRNGNGAGTPLGMAVKTWPTANTRDSVSAARHTTTTGVSHPGTTLTDAIRRWPTPVEDNANNQGGPARQKGMETGEGHQDLTVVATLWQTPSTDSFRHRGGDRADEKGLDQQARFFPTPAARDYRTPNKRGYQERSGTKKGEQLQNFVEHRFPSHQDPLTQDGPTSSGNTQTSRRRLNPRFAEWLLGFPVGWTEVSTTEPSGSRA